MRKKAQWNDVLINIDGKEVTDDEVVECSNCQARLDYKFLYCPFCGCEMSNPAKFEE